MFILNFIIKLLLLKKPIIKTIYNSILITIDKLIKYIYFLLYKEVNNIEELIYTFFKTITN